MDDATRELLESCEQHLRRDNNEEFGDLARDDMPALMRVVREQDAELAKQWRQIERLARWAGVDLSELENE